MGGLDLPSCTAQLSDTCLRVSDALQVTLVGKLVQVGEQPTCLTFKLDDGTGQIDLSLWVTDDEQDLVHSM